jgi:hypothetical protein
LIFTGTNRPFLVYADEKRFLLAIHVVTAVCGRFVCGFAEGQGHLISGQHGWGKYHQYLR